MPVAEKPQHMQALAEANRIRRGGVAQRKALRGKGEREITRAVVDPTPELGSFRLRLLFTPNTHTGGGLIAGIGPHNLERAFNVLAEKYPLGRQNWHGELRLSELTKKERRRLVTELFSRGAHLSQRAAA